MKLNRILATGAAMSFFGVVAQAQNLNGTLDSAFYGSPLTVQSINTGFGNSTGVANSQNDDYNGSELDAAYGVVSGGNLYLFLAGNLQAAGSLNSNSGNSLQIFIGGGGSTVGQNTLSTSVSPLSNMNGSTFAAGMNATLAFTLNDYQGTLYTDAANLQSGGGGYLGAVGLSDGVGNGINTSGNSYSLTGFQEGFNNTLVSTMGASGSALSGSGSGANATTGLELLIPLSDLGTISGNIQVTADIDNGGLSYLSNQFLPGLSTGTQDLGTSTFSDAPYFTVPVPEPTNLALLGFSGLGTLLALRRRK
jgi:hypothetical protein